MTVLPSIEMVSGVTNEIASDMSQAIVLVRSDRSSLR
jgi:hypothetical protein